MRFRVCLSESVKSPLETFKVSREYSTKTRITRRTVQVGEAFGIGIDESKRFQIFNNFEVNIDPGNVVLITGDSGSGKSTLLQEVSSQIAAKGTKEFKGEVVSNSSVQIDPGELIIEGVGKDISEAISVLSMSGLNEAFLMLRKFKELSDGQKYRYRIARMIDSKSSVWIFDEFCFDKYTMVYTEKGPKFISGISPGDKVLSNDAQFHEVTRTFESKNRDYQFRLKVGYHNYPVYLTPNHPVWAKTSFFTDQQKRGSVARLRLVSRNASPLWIPAGKLSRGDCVYYPVSKLPTQYQECRISQILSDESVFQGLDGFAYYSARRMRNRTSLPIPDKIILDEKLGRLLGYYVAEGSQGPRFTLNSSEVEFANDIERLIREVFDVNPAYKGRGAGNSRVVSYHSEVLTRFFKRLCGEKASNKKVPLQLFNSPKNVVLEFLKGWFLGDGAKATSTGTTMSRILAEQLFVLGLSVGIVCSVNRAETRSSYIRGREIHHSRPYIHQIGLTTADREIAEKLGINYTEELRDGFFDKDGFWAFVTDVWLKKASSKKSFYNMEVKDTNTYVTTHGLAHNCALLDRVTAKCVSYTIQKTARKLGKTLIVATTHEDLLEDLKPDIWIQKKFGSQVLVRTFAKDYFDKHCSILSQIKIEECKMKEIEHLEQFHYRGKISNLVKRVFKGTLNSEVVAAIVFVPPHLQLKGRNIALPEFHGKSDRAMAQKVNSEIVRIARVIVAPKFRSIGLGAEMVRQTMPKVNFRYVETLAVMAKFNSFFESAGMTRVDVQEDEKAEKDLRGLESMGFRRELLPSRKHVESVVSRLDQKELEYCRKFALKYCAVAKRRAQSLIPKIKELDRDAIISALKLHSSRPLYLYWRNPLL